MLYLPVGIPGCGKSTLAAALVCMNRLDPLAIVSPDDYREKLTGDAANQEENKTAFLISNLITETRLRRQLDVFVDATNLTSLGQMQALAERRNAEIKVILFTNTSRAITQNTLRKNPVPGSVMTKMLADFATVRAGFIPGTVITPEEALTGAI